MTLNTVMKHIKLVAVFRRGQFSTLSKHNVKHNVRRCSKSCGARRGKDSRIRGRHNGPSRSENPRRSGKQQKCSHKQYQKIAIMFHWHNNVYYEIVNIVNIVREDEIAVRPIVQSREAAG